MLLICTIPIPRRVLQEGVPGAEERWLCRGQRHSVYHMLIWVGLLHCQAPACPQQGACLHVAALRQLQSAQRHLAAAVLIDASSQFGIGQSNCVVPYCCMC